MAAAVTPHKLQPNGGLGPIRGQAPSPRDRQIQEPARNLAAACREVESLFLAQLLGQMRRTLLSGLKTSAAEAERYAALADQEVARTLAAGGGIGLAQRLCAHLSGPRLARPQGGTHGSPANPQPLDASPC